jgi:hypothetical protein
MDVGLVNQLLDSIGSRAKMNREKIGYKADFQPVAIAVGPQMEMGILPLDFTDNKSMCFGFQVLAVVAAEMNVQAIVLVCDVRWGDSEKFTERFHMKPIREVGHEEWTQEMLSIIEDLYGGTLRNCPRDLWGEAVVLGIKGPLIEPTVRMHCYRQSGEDGIEWVDGPEIPKGMDVPPVIDALLDWWKTGATV